MQLAAEAIGPVIGGCAGALAGPAGAAVGAAIGVQLRTKAQQAAAFVVDKAINYFGPPIVEKWLAWMRSEPKPIQMAAVSQLGSLTPEEARQEAADEIGRIAPNASPEDKAVALEYLAAIPGSVRRSLVTDASGRTTLPPTLPPDDERTLLQLLPTTVPPYPPGTPVPGTPYRLEALLGTGGFGAVYRATDPNLQHLPLAIKFCLDASMVDSLRNDRDNLEHLMQAGKGNWSEQIVRLYGYNLEHKTPFLVYEYVPGGDLAGYLVANLRPQQRLSPSSALKIVRQVAEGLSFAHQRGLVHRDLKPANVLVGRKTLKLADFGIGGVVAQHAAGHSRIGSSVLSELTRAEKVSLYRGAGTPLYMSPEQRRGEAADPRHDLYSLGVMWYQLLVSDVTRELHPGWDEELREECEAPEEQIEVLRRCVGLFKKRPGNAAALLTLLPKPDPATATPQGKQPSAVADEASPLKTSEASPATPSTASSTQHQAGQRGEGEIPDSRVQVRIRQPRKSTWSDQHAADDQTRVEIYLDGKLVGEGKYYMGFEVSCCTTRGQHCLTVFLIAGDQQEKNDYPLSFPDAGTYDVFLRPNFGVATSRWFAGFVLTPLHGRSRG